MCKALEPSTELRALTWTVSLWSNSRTTSEWPKKAAMCKALEPYTELRALTWTLSLWSNCRTTSEWPR
eukprot:5845154-Amphidinium_carterae.1